MTQTGGDGDVAQLPECRTGTPLTQVRFPGVAWDFSPRINFQCRLFYGVRAPRVQLHALIYVRTLKILQLVSEFGRLWKH